MNFGKDRSLEQLRDILNHSVGHKSTHFYNSLTVAIEQVQLLPGAEPVLTRVVGESGPRITHDAAFGRISAHKKKWRPEGTWILLFQTSLLPQLFISSESTFT